MAVVTCTSTSGSGSSSTRYTCAGLFCARKIKKLKALDAANPNASSSLPIGELKLLELAPGPEDAMVVGTRKFDLDAHDVIVSDLGNEVLDVVVFLGDEIIFRAKRPQRHVVYLAAARCPVNIMEAFSGEEDFIRVDVADLEQRYFKQKTATR